MTVSELLAWGKKWDKEAVQRAIVLSEQSKTVPLANDAEVETPSKYIEVYELRGELPEKWINPEAEVRWAFVRSQRDRDLFSSDWTQGLDSPLSNEKKLEWASYRQALRDITTQPDPFNVIWPIKPR